MCSRGPSSGAALLAVFAGVLCSCFPSVARADGSIADLQYFLPQEFLLDLPLRHGSFADEVMDMLRKQEFPDVQSEDVDAGVFQNVYATSDLNAPKYKAARKICTKVPPGANKGGDPRMCERPGAAAPHAVIKPPTPGVEHSEGSLELTAEFEMSLRGHLHVWTRTCAIACWKNRLCDDDVALAGSFRVTSAVDVVREPGTGRLGLRPSTRIDFTDGPHSRGCKEEWLLRFFRDVNEDVSASVRAMVRRWVAERLQPQVRVEQAVQLLPNVTVAYAVTRLDFVPDWAEAGARGHVRLEASASVRATAPDGTVRTFPEGRGAAGGAAPPGPAWRRTAGSGPGQTVLLGGLRVSQRLLGRVFEGMHHAGALSPSTSAPFHGARMLSALAMSRPSLDIEAGGRGAVLREASLHLSVACPDQRGGGAYTLLEAAFAGAAQRVLVAPFVARDHGAMGLTLQLRGASLAAANMTACRTSTFLGGRGQLRALAQRALHSAIPRINEQLARWPLLFCGGGGAACGLVPLVPRPRVVTVPPAPGRAGAGYVQISWSCSCSGAGHYQQCQGFQCPDAYPVAELERRPRSSPRTGAAGQGPSLFTHLSAAGIVPERRLGAAHVWRTADDPSSSVYFTAFSGAGAAGSEGSGCSFGAAGSTLRFGALRASGGREPAPDGSEDLLGHSYRLVQEEDGAFVLHVGCPPAGSSAACLYSSRRLRLHECGAVRAGRPGAAGGAPVRFMLSGAAPSTAWARRRPAPECLGGRARYRGDDALLLATGASPASAFLQAVHLGGGRPGAWQCAPCGMRRDLWCGVQRDGGGGLLAASLLCDRCPLPGSNASCLIPRRPLWMGSWLRAPGEASGYGQVAVVTSRLLPMLRPCLGRPWDPHSLHSAVGVACLVCLAMASLAIASFVLKRAHLLDRAHACAAPLLDACGRSLAALKQCAPPPRPRLRVVPPPDELQARTHVHLWVSAGLLLLCGVVWRLQTPASSLAAMEGAVGVAEPERGVSPGDVLGRSRGVGLATFATIGGLLLALSLSMLIGDERLPHGAERPGHSACAAEEEDGEEEEGGLAAPPLPASSAMRTLWTPMQWYLVVAITLSESTSAVAFLAFSFWRGTYRDFDAWESYAGEASVAIFAIKLLLSWIGPFLLVAHSTPVVVLCSYTRALSSSRSWQSAEQLSWVARTLQPFVLASILIHASIEVVLSIVYYRSGYGSVAVLLVTFAGACLNIAAFALHSPARPPEEGPGSGAPPARAAPLLGAAQLAGCLGLAACLGRAGGWPFLLASLAASSYPAWASTELFVEMSRLAYESDPCAAETWESSLGFGSPFSPRRPGAPSPGSPGASPLRPLALPGSPEPEEAGASGAARAGAALAALAAWLLEQREGREKARFGARIKGRRLCLLLGAACLAVSARRAVRAALAADPWDDVDALVAGVAGRGAAVAREHAPLFAPLVAAYGLARQRRAACTGLGAALFAAAAALDAVGSGSPRMLRACRLCCFAATLAYVAGVLVGNMPDYVGMLDFSPTLGRCGSDFCTAVAASIRAAFGAASLAESAGTFMPVLVSLPWTLGRIAFFLSVDSENTRAVTALTWGTLSCMLRLSILPATVAFICRPVALIAGLYVLFLLAPSLFLLWVIATKRTHALWYILWGWVFFMVPLLAMGSVAMREGVCSLWLRLCRTLLSQENWPVTLAEFTLSDVVISDMFFMLL